jgi:hypothetical protein
MKPMTFFLSFVLLGSLLFSLKVGMLPELTNPDNITLYDDELYVVEGPTIYVYALKDLRFIRKFGKRGQGPGELLAIPGTPNKINVQEDFILAETYVKLIWFTKEGKLIKEKKKPIFGLIGFIPIGKKGEKFVARWLKLDEDKVMYDTICLFNEDIKPIKKLYKQKWIQQGAQPPNIQLDMVPDFISFKVYEDKIFIDESSNGFVIEIFDINGNPLRRIEKKYDKIKVTEEDKERLINRLKEEKYSKVQSQMVGGWENLKKILNMKFANTYPPIQDIDVSANKIFVQTHKRVEEKGQVKEEYVVMDFKGNILRKVMIPEIITSVQAREWGAEMNSMYKGKLYYLLENIDEETWELHVHDMK